jgi:hypothetical protein
MMHTYQITTPHISTLKMKASCIAENFTPSPTTTQQNNPRTKINIIDIIMINNTSLQHKFLASELQSHKDVHTEISQVCFLLHNIFFPNFNIDNSHYISA